MTLPVPLRCSRRSSRPRLFRGTAAILLLSAAWAAPSRAYEGAGQATEQPPEPPKPPQLTKPPALLKTVEAAYPEALLTKNVGGDVLLLIDIAADGTVPKADVSRSSGYPEFDAAAQAALLQHLFSPAEFDGKPGPVRLEFMYHFEARAPPPPKPEEPPPPAPVNLRGLVLERGTREPLALASVYLPNANLVTETDAKGVFELQGVPIGPNVIRIDESGHRRFETTEEVKAGEVTQITAYMWKKIDNGNEIIVRGAKEKKEVSRRTLEAAELKSVPGTFGDPLRVIQNMPGMGRAAYTGGALLVRGAQPEDTGVYIDGMRIPLLYHFAGGPSVITPSLIDQIDFFPGAYGSKYGRAIAGIVDVSTKDRGPRQMHGNFDVDVLDSGFFLESPVSVDHPEYGHWAIAGRRSYFDLFLPIILDFATLPGQTNVVAAPRYWDYQLRYDVSIGKNNLSAVIFGSDDRLVVSQAGDAETQGFNLFNRQGFQRGRFQWSRRLSENLKIYVAPGFGYSVSETNIGTVLKLSRGTWDYFLRSAVAWEPSKSFSIEFGTEIVGSRYDVDLQLPGQPTYITFPGEQPDLGPSSRKFTVDGGAQAVYVEAVWKPLEGLRIVPGLRLEGYNLPKNYLPSLEPRVAVRYDFNDAFALKAAWGIFRQNPQPDNLDEVFGNPYLGLLRSQQNVAGLEWHPRDKLLVDFQGFYNWRDQLVVQSDEFVERDGTRVRERFSNKGIGAAYGLELLIKQDVTERMYGWLAYTIARSEQKNPVTGEWFAVSSDQTHIVTFVGSYKWDGGWETGARFRLTTGRPTDEILGATFDADSNNYRAYRSPAGTVRGPIFHQLDLRVEKLWTFEQWKFSAYLDVQNVYNAENPELLLNDYRFRKQAAVRGLPILPTLGVTGSF